MSKMLARGNAFGTGWLSKGHAGHVISDLISTAYRYLEFQRDLVKIQQEGCDKGCAEASGNAWTSFATNCLPAISSSGSLKVT